MEEANREDEYWMWMKRKQNNNPLMKYNSSWEEKAFAQDLSTSSSAAAGGGSLGGCIWPPRSYSCSFCMREFRSAQALGGHMNVHRRDRARLKQCLFTPHSTTPPQLFHHHHHDSNVINNHILVDPNYSFPHHLLQSSTNLSSNDSRNISATKDINDDGKNLQYSRSTQNIFDAETDLGVDLKLNSVFGRNRRNSSGSCCEENDHKRTKVMAISPPLLIKHCHLQSEVIEFKVGSSSMDDLDLELRLG